MHYYEKDLSTLKNLIASCQALRNDLSSLNIIRNAPVSSFVQKEGFSQLALEMGFQRSKLRLIPVATLSESGVPLPLFAASCSWRKKKELHEHLLVLVLVLVLHRQAHQKGVPFPHRLMFCRSLATISFKLELLLVHHHTKETMTDFESPRIPS